MRVNESKGWDGETDVLWDQEKTRALQPRAFVPVLLVTHAKTTHLDHFFVVDVSRVEAQQEKSILLCGSTADVPA